MITSGLLLIIYYFILAVEYPLTALPDVSLPANITGAISNANQYLASFNFIFPVSTFFSIVGLVLGIELVVIIYKIVMWVIKKVPTIS